MTTIHKYRLEVTDHQVVEMPRGAEVLSVADQVGAGVELALWALVDTEAPPEARHFAIAGTGNPASHSLTAERFVGTTLSRDGGIVWHVFDLGEG